MVFKHSTPAEGLFSKITVQYTKKDMSTALIEVEVVDFKVT